MLTGFGIAFGGAVVHAGATVSASNDPSASLGGQLRALFGRERSALSDLESDALRRLVIPGTPDQDVSFTKAYLASVPAPESSEPLNCLSEALYFEARGESVRGQFAVAEVILNRTESALFPDTVCDVIHQGTGRKYQCQFTYTCDGHPEAIHEKGAYAQVRKVAALALAGAADPQTEGATYYHTKHVSPSWSRKFPRTATIGVHHFYRHPTQVVNR